MTTTLEVQRRLKSIGFDPGPLDGIRGRRTIEAVRRFQTAFGLAVDGLVGPKTLAALFAEKGQENARVPAGLLPDAAPWMDIALRKMGLHEGRNHSALMSWLRSDGKTLGDPMKLPWCGDFVETCVALALPSEPLPTNPYLARNWLKFGKWCEPRPGAVMVFSRGDPNGISGHVCFCAGETADAYTVIGGNQSNAVTETLISKGRFLGARWPATALAAKTTIQPSIGIPGPSGPKQPPSFWAAFLAAVARIFKSIVKGGQ